MSEEKNDNLEIDPEELAKKVQSDPKSKNYNNPNSRKNLKQYQAKRASAVGSESSELVFPEILDEDDDGEILAEEITRGKKLSRNLVLKLIPDRGVFTPAEKKRFTGIVIQYLADFREEEPTASDIDDIFEIAKSDVLEMRVLSATRNDPAALLTSSQFLEKNNKRKQTAKENLAARRSDRKDPKAVQGLNIVDLVVSFDLDKKKQIEARVDSLKESEEETTQKLKDVLEKDGY